MFKPSKFQKHTRIKIYNNLTLPTVLYESENWTIKAEEKAELQ
jgi:hypothetical protein